MTASYHVVVSPQELTEQLLSIPFARAQYGKHAVKSWSEHMLHNAKRQGTLLLRNPGYLFGKITDNLLIGLALGSLFWNLGRDEVVSKLGCLVFALVLAAFSNFSILPAALESRNVIQKQAALGFFPESAFVWATMLAQVPVVQQEQILQIRVPRIRRSNLNIFTSTCSQFHLHSMVLAMTSY
jgi:hypothetical protein